jgi:hypothetical protein
MLAKRVAGALHAPSPGVLVSQRDNPAEAEASGGNGRQVPAAFEKDDIGCQRAHGHP